jgi:hypothetical protein
MACVVNRKYSYLKVIYLILVYLCVSLDPGVHSGLTGEEIRLLQQILYVLYLLEKAVNAH